MKIIGLTGELIHQVDGVFGPAGGIIVRVGNIASYDAKVIAHFDKIIDNADEIEDHNDWIIYHAQNIKDDKDRSFDITDDIIDSTHGLQSRFMAVLTIYIAFMVIRSGF